MNSNDPSAASTRAASRLVFWVLTAFVLFYLVTEHRAHLFGWLPFLVILSCPLLHRFMHGGHGHGGHRHGSDRGEGRPGGVSPVANAAGQGDGPAHYH